MTSKAEIDQVLVPPIGRNRRRRQRAAGGPSIYRRRGRRDGVM